MDNAFAGLWWFVGAGLILVVVMIVLAVAGVRRGARPGNRANFWVSLAFLLWFLPRLFSPAPPHELPPARVHPPGQKRLNECQGNLYALSLKLEEYRRQHSRYPEQLPKTNGLFCPVTRTDTYSPGYAASETGYTLMCQGSNHGEAGLQADHPRLVK